MKNVYSIVPLPHTPPIGTTQPIQLSWLQDLSYLLRDFRLISKTLRPLSRLQSAGSSRDLAHPVSARSNCTQQKTCPLLSCPALSRQSASKCKVRWTHRMRCQWVGGHWSLDNPIHRQPQLPNGTAPIPLIAIGHLILCSSNLSIPETLRLKGICRMYVAHICLIRDQPPARQQEISDKTHRHPPHTYARHCEAWL